MFRPLFIHLILLILCGIPTFAHSESAPSGPIKSVVAITGAQAKEWVANFSGNIETSTKTASLSGQIAQVCIEHLKIEANEKPNSKNLVVFSLLDLDGKGASCLKEHKCSANECVSFSDLNKDSKTKERFQTQIKIAAEDMKPLKIGLLAKYTEPKDTAAKLEGSVPDCDCDKPVMPGPQESVNKSFDPNEMKKTLALAQGKDASIDAKPKPPGPPPGRDDSSADSEETKSRAQRRTKPRPPRDDDEDDPRLSGRPPGSNQMSARNMSMGGMSNMSMGGMSNMSMGGMSNMSMGGMSNMGMGGMSNMGMGGMSNMGMGGMSNMGMGGMSNMRMGGMSGMGMPNSMPPPMGSVGLTSGLNTGSYGSNYYNSILPTGYSTTSRRRNNTNSNYSRYTNRSSYTYPTRGYYGLGSTSTLRSQSRARR